MTKYALPHVRQTKGIIICAGSEAGMKGEPGHMTYGGTKGFLHAFVAGVAVEQAKDGVRANCAGVGSWDESMRDGSWKEGRPRFPLAIGTDAHLVGHIATLYTLAPPTHATAASRR